MNRVSRNLIAAAVALATLAASPALLAQTAKPATLGGKEAKPGGKVMTREELRACMGRIAEINKATPGLEAERATLDRERAELTQSAEALKADRAEIDRHRAVVRDWDVRMRAHSQDVDVWNKRVADYKAAGRSANEEQGKEIDADRGRLEKIRALLVAEERVVVPAYEEAVKQFNARAAQRDQRVDAWNKRNALAVEASTRHSDERQDWLGQCGGRPYREDDEKAIQAGK